MDLYAGTVMDVKIWILNLYVSITMHVKKPTTIYKTYM
jgi:hypothetical protein